MDAYDLIVVGTGFASTFFLREWLRTAPETARVLVLERGPRRSHAWQLEHRRTLQRRAQTTFTSPDKEWDFTLAVGGSSACWYACTPRMMPEDFALATTYGAGVDWPVSYDELERLYVEVEHIMGVSGSQGATPFPMSEPYPLPPHGLSDPDKLLQAAAPDQFVPQPTARSTRSWGNRAPCCGNTVCRLCPIDAKFTILNGLFDPYEDPRVELRAGAFVTEVEVQGSTATGVRWRTRGTDQRAAGSLVALGANALFNPWLLLRSGLDGPAVGVGLGEQRSAMVTVQLDGLDALQGTTSITGQHYGLYAGAHRRTESAICVETWNSPILQDVRGKWRRRWRLKLVIAGLRNPENRVVIDPDDPDKPLIVYDGPSDRVHRALAGVRPRLEALLDPVPMESLRVSGLTATESHSLGSACMGDDPATSVVDRHLVHHRVRNLLVLGGSAFPTFAPANPTLTISALSMWAARAL